MRLAFSVLVLAALVGLLEVSARLFGPASGERLATQNGLAIRIGLGELNQVLVPDDRLFWALRRSMPPTRISGRIGLDDSLAFTVSTTQQGRRSVPRAPGPASHTVLFAGDSCTFGVGVDDESSFPSLTQSLEPRLRAVNAGVPGYSAFQGRRLVEDILGSEKPWVVTLQFGFNDAAVWDGRGDEEHGRLLPKGLAFLSSSRFVRMVFSFATPWRSPSLPSTATPSARPRLTPAEFSVELQRAVGACRRAGSVPLLVIWPKRSQMRDREPSPYDEALRSLSASVHALLVDLVPVFRAHGAEALFADVVHANVQGNRVAAEAIHEALSRVPKSPQRSQPG